MRRRPVRPPACPGQTSQTSPSTLAIRLTPPLRTLPNTALLFRIDPLLGKPCLPFPQHIPPTLPCAVWPAVRAQRGPALSQKPPTAPRRPTPGSPGAPNGTRGTCPGGQIQKRDCPRPGPRAPRCPPSRAPHGAQRPVLTSSCLLQLQQEEGVGLQSGPDLAVLWSPPRARAGKRPSTPSWGPGPQPVPGTLSPPRPGH